MIERTDAELEDYNLSAKLGRTYLPDEEVADLGPQSTVRLDRKAAPHACASSGLFIIM